MIIQRVLVISILVFIEGILLGGIHEVEAQSLDTLNVGIIPFKTHEQVLESYQPLFEYIGEQIEVPVKIELVNEGDLGYLLAKRRFDIGIFTPFPYLRAKQDFPELEIFASHIINGKDHYTGAFVTTNDSKIVKIGDLKGRRVMFVKPTSTSGFLYPKGILEEYNIDLEEEDIAYDFSGGHDQSLLSLEQGLVDAIAIDLNSLTSKSPSIDSFRVLHTYSVPYHAYVFSPDVVGALKSNILETMLSANKDPEIRPAFKNELGIEKWVGRNDDYYNSMRRYLQFTRIKPAIRPRIDTKPSARASFAKTGDLLDVLMDNIINELRESERFIVTTVNNQNNFHELKLDVSMIQDIYQCQIYLDNNRIEYFTDVDLPNLQKEIPKGITQAVLTEFTIETELLKNDTSWFITYGRDDGIDEVDYQFVLSEEDGSNHIIPNDEIIRLEERNTYFKENDRMYPQQTISVQYAGKAFKTNLTSSMPENNDLVFKNFWDDKDNQWGIIGLVVTLVGVIIGWYFTRKKQKRFRNMLFESNQLLLQYIKGHYKLDNEVIAHKEKINQFLEKGYITENQYLILKHRIEDIHNIIQQILGDPEGLDSSIINEVKEIINDGVLTEKEYSRLVALVQQRKPS